MLSSPLNSVAQPPSAVFVEREFPTSASREERFQLAVSPHRTARVALVFLPCALVTLLLFVTGCAAPLPLSKTHDVVHIEGFTIRPNHAWRRDNRDQAQAVVIALKEDLSTISRVVPPTALRVLRTRPIWIEKETPAATEGFTGRGMAFHPSKSWLAANGIAPEKAGAVDICNAADYLQWRTHQQMMVLHELAHAYHWLLGFERADVKQAYDAAMAAGTYDAVTYILSIGAERRRAYAANNPQEYFAELSEAWFGRNDYSPFTRDELRAVDPDGAVVVEKLWNLDENAIRSELDHARSQTR